MELRDKNGLTEREYLAQYRADKYPRPSVTVDVCIFSRAADGALRTLLIRRGGHPFLGWWALPGGFAQPGERVEEAAARELEEETNLSGLTGVRGRAVIQVDIFFIAVEFAHFQRQGKPLDQRPDGFVLLQSGSISRIPHGHRRGDGVLRLISGCILFPRLCPAELRRLGGRLIATGRRTDRALLQCPGSRRGGAVFRGRDTFPAGRRTAGDAAPCKGCQQNLSHSRGQAENL